MDDFVLKDSGERQEFETGAVRDCQEGKGRYDLLSPIVNKRLALIMERGAKKYAARNWEKGMPLTRFIDSAKRHLDQFIEGHRDEDHLGQAIWNLCSLLHIEEMVKRGVLDNSLNDLPHYLPKKDPEIKEPETKTEESTAYDAMIHGVRFTGTIGQVNFAMRNRKDRDEVVLSLVRHKTPRYLGLDCYRFDDEPAHCGNWMYVDGLVLCKHINGFVQLVGYYVVSKL